MSNGPDSVDIQPLPGEPSLLGESPLWHPLEQRLYWCDIPGRTLHRFDPADGAHRAWAFEQDLGCCAARDDGRLLVAQRDGVRLFDPQTGTSAPLAAAPYDTRVARCNDGRTDPRGRFWVGTIHEPRDAAHAALYRLDGGTLVRIAGDITTSNGLAWSPDGRTMYWADTKAHRVTAWDYDLERGLPSNPRLFVQFEPPAPGTEYLGRPDGAAVDAEGCYWVAMFEGGRVLRYSPAGELLQTLLLPVRCPTMPCFGGADRRTLYITSARDKRPAEELAALPWSGRVLQLRVDVPGLPATLARSA